MSILRHCSDDGTPLRPHRTLARVTGQSGDPSTNGPRTHPTDPVSTRTVHSHLVVSVVWE